ncbi:hypothetical protein MAR_000897, partial [Mya arenaria]
MQMNEVNNLNEDDKIHGQKCKKRDQDARQAALQRWNILREVILSGRGGGGDDSVSVRRFKSYGLLSTNKVTVDADSPDTARNWFIYTCPSQPDFSMQIRNKCVIELGGGMTCLTGVSLGLQSAASYIELTDGNEDSVSSMVNSLILINGFCRESSQVNQQVAEMGQWTAGCRPRREGEAWLFAPKRGETFDEFVVQARSQFLVTVQQIYDDQIWKLHTQMESLGQDHYDADIHYPWFIHLTPLPGPRSPCQATPPVGYVIIFTNCYTSSSESIANLDTVNAGPPGLHFPSLLVHALQPPLKNDCLRRE